MSDTTVSRGGIGQLRATGRQLVVEWEIPDFLAFSLLRKYDSPTYFFADTSWFLRVYADLKGSVGFYVKRGDSGPPVTVTYSLFLKKRSGRKEVLSECTFTFKKPGTGHGHPKALKRSELIDEMSEFLPSGTLTVVCSLKLNGEREVKVPCGILKDYNMCSTVCVNAFEDSATGSEQVAAAPAQDTKVLRDFEDLLRSGKFCDLTLNVCGQVFEVHRAILGARCPVFASMLTHDMKEKNTGLVDVQDCDPEHFPEFLRFLYCGSGDGISSQNACSLYKAADRYDVTDLKSQCVAFLESHLDVGNFCDVIAVALRHGEAGLVKRATDFFADNMLEIVVTVEWQVFLHENTTEGNELIIKAAKKNSGKF